MVVALWIAAIWAVVALAFGVAWVLFFRGVDPRRKRRPSDIDAALESAIDKQDPQAVDDVIRKHGA